MLFLQKRAGRRQKILGVIQKVRSLRWGRGRVIEKQTKTNRGRWGVLAFAFLKKMLRFSKWSFIVILQFFLLLIMAVWNIKQAIMKDYNIQSCQWMAWDCLREPFYFAQLFRYFLCTVHYFFCAFLAKMAAYSLVIDNACFAISSY